MGCTNSLDGMSPKPRKVAPTAASTQSSHRIMKTPESNRSQVTVSQFEVNSKIENKSGTKSRLTESVIQSNKKYSIVPSTETDTLKTQLSLKGDISKSFAAFYKRNAAQGEECEDDDYSDNDLPNVGKFAEDIVRNGQLHNRVVKPKTRDVKTKIKNPKSRTSFDEGLEGDDEKDAKVEE